VNSIGAKAQQSRNRADQEQDLLQDAIARICGVLPTARGELAERAWLVFCRNAFEDAWRERYGRRGENLRWIREEADCSAEGEKDDSLYRLSNDESPWRVIWEHEQSERIEAIVASVASSLQDDPFVQEVARAAWGSGQRPKTSGAEVVDRDPPLAGRFPGKSRHQINRALRYVDSRLAAALLAEPCLKWSDDNVAFLQLQASRGKRS
jgi:hypothetical protein